MIAFSNAFLRSLRDFYFFKKKKLFSQHIAMENSRLEEENIIKDIRNFFTLRKELNYTATRDMKNPFRREKETKAIKEESLEILRIFLSMKKKKLL